MFRRPSARVPFRSALGLSILAAAVLVAGAATPPAYLNYQGVLRDASDRPLDGRYDMIFRFITGTGVEILIDKHTTAEGGFVTVSGGLFNVTLGSGLVQDGSGPGTYTSLAEVFRDHPEVLLRIEVNGETLSPEVRVVAAAYALNSSHLGGKAPSQFLDTTAASQGKAGKLVLGQSPGTSSNHGLEVFGIDAAGYFADLDGSGVAHVASGDYGIRALGNTAGGYFEDRDSGSRAYLALGAHGIEGYGSLKGGLFRDSDSSGYAHVGVGDRGIEALGNEMGGYFKDANHSGYAYVGIEDGGIDAIGSAYGGFFGDLDNSGYAYVGFGDRGIDAYGNSSGGYFADLNSSGYAYVGSGDRGIEAFGNSVGGYFKDQDSSGYANIGIGDTGLEAHGNMIGGFFSDLNSSGYAFVGVGDTGIQGYGNTHGGFFADSNNSGQANVGSGDRGIWGKGTFAGATFSHPDNVTYWADVSQIFSATTYKIRGTGQVSFVQNHPWEKDKVVVYAAPEGDEVAVYTRGSARLADGEARVRLGETFALVANPDVGITAHLTPREEPVPLSVESVSTSELIVRGPSGSNAAFDYLVYGLRVGFEEHAPVQIKDREAFLPPREAAAEFFGRHPELRRHNALERFKTMETAHGRGRAIDLSRAHALAAAIDQNREEIVAAARARAEEERALYARPEPEAAAAGAARPLEDESPQTSAGAPAGRKPRSVDAAVAESIGPAAEEGTWLPVAEPVEAGDVLVLDATRPGMLRRAAAMAHPDVIGIAAGPSRSARDGGLETPMAEGRYATVKVDAGYGAIRPGDLLVASPTPGHAMRAVEALPAGTVLGKAVEPLDTGTGTIRVLLILR